MSWRDETQQRRIAIITLPLAGHMNPMGVLADALKARGHKVVVVGPPKLCDLARAHMPGVDTFTISDAEYPPGRLEGFVNLLPDVRGLRGIRRVITEIADLSALYARELPGALRTLQADTVVADQLEPAAGVIARALGLSHASIACALPMNREPALPPPYLGWPFRDHPLWRSLYGGGYLVIDRMMAPQAEVLRHTAARYGLPEKSTVSDWVSHDCDLSQCIPGFDYPRRTGPTHLGPLRRREPFGPDGFERDGRELVFCSLGTIMGGRRDLFEAVAQACARNVVQCVIAHGGRLSDSDVAHLSALPGQPVVRDFVNQENVLSECRAAVLHGGFNSVLDALSGGVPMVLLPLAFEQAAIAARVKRAGAGVVLRRPTAESIGSSLEAVLNHRKPRKAALEFARASAMAGGVVSAVMRIEASRPHPNPRLQTPEVGPVRVRRRPFARMPR